MLLRVAIAGLTHAPESVITDAGTEVVRGRSGTTEVEPIDPEDPLLSLDNIIVASQIAGWSPTFAEQSGRGRGRMGRVLRAGFSVLSHGSGGAGFGHASIRTSSAGPTSRTRAELRG